MPDPGLDTGAFLTELDHVMVAVRDHHAAIASYQRLGFSVRPVRQLVPMGGGRAGGDGGSAAVLLHPRTGGAANFIEIAKADPATAAPALKALLCAGEGVAMLVHATAEPTAAHRHFEAMGLRCQALHMSLQPMGPGEPVDVDIVLPEPGQARLMFNAMRMSSTADFERDEWRQHPNSAYAWCGITYVEAPRELARTVQTMTSLYGTAPTRQETGAYRFCPGHVSLELTTAQRLAQRLGIDVVEGESHRPHGALLSFEVRSLDTTRRVLQAGGVPFHDAGTSVIVQRRELHGVAAEFRAA